MKLEVVCASEPAPEGGFLARALRHWIDTEAYTWEDLSAAGQDAVACHFDEDYRPFLSNLLNHVGLNVLCAL